MDTEKLDGLIRKLPAEYQAWASYYIPAIMQMQTDKIEAWIADISKGNWQQAYEYLVENMSTEDILEAQFTTNQILKELNKQNADNITLQKKMVADAISIGFMIMQANLL